MIFTGLTRYREGGLLFLRIGIGLCFMAHGIPKLLAGPDRWAALGRAMGNIGITFYPVGWGFMAGFAEAVGGLMIVLGLFFRPACILLLFTMFVASLRHIKAGDGFSEYSHALESGIVFLALIFIGPGKYSIDKK